MPYDNQGLPVSIIIDGVDLRAQFGFEAAGGVAGRHAVRLDRSTASMPNTDGDRVTARSYRPTPVAVSGWIPKAELAAFRQFLEELGIADQPRTSVRHYVQFADDHDTRYIFDTVSEISTAPIGKGSFWFLAEEIGISFTLSVLHARPSSQVAVDALLHGDSGSYMQNVWQVLASAPAFVMGGKPADWAAVRTRGSLRAVIRMGKCDADVRIGAVVHGAISDFKLGPKARNTFGEVVDVVRYAPADLLTNGDLEAGYATGWSNADMIPQNNGVIYDPDSYKAVRISSGTNAASMKPAGSGTPEFYQNFAVTSGEEYWVVAEVYCPSSATMIVEVRDATTGTIQVLKTLSASEKGRLLLIESTFLAATSNNHRLTFRGAAGGTKFYVCRARVAQAELSNGSMDGSFSAGVAAGWTLSAGTGAVETTEIHLGSGGGGTRQAQKITLNGGGPMQFYQDVSLANDKLYRFTAWVKCEAAAGAMTIRVRNASAVNTNVAATLQSQFRIASGGEYEQISATFHTLNAGATGTNRIMVEVPSGQANDILYLDDVQVTELSEATDGLYLEPGPNGTRLQVPVGDAVAMATDTHINQIASTLVARFMRTFAGQRTVIQAARNQLNGVTVTDCELQGFSVAVAEDQSSSRGYVQEDAYTALSAMAPFQSGPGGNEGVAVSYDGSLFHGTQRVRIAAERSGLADDTRLRMQDGILAKEETVSLSDYGADSMNCIILGDAGYFDGFWALEYALPTDRLCQEASALTEPPFINRIMTYGAAIEAGDQVIIDTARGSIVHWDSSTQTLSSAWENVTGDLPEFLGDQPVLVIDKEVRGVSLSAPAYS